MARIHYELGKFANGDGLGRALRGRDLERAVNAAAELQVSRLKQAFDHGGHQKRGGERWHPLAESTKKQKRRRGRTKILVDTGRLRNSIRQVTIRSPEGVRTTFAADAPYAGFHQDGTSRMVQRRILVVVTRDEKEIARAVARAANRIVNGEA